MSLPALPSSADVQSRPFAFPSDLRPIKFSAFPVQTGRAVYAALPVFYYVFDRTDALRLYPDQPTTAAGRVRPAERVMFQLIFIAPDIRTESV